MKTKVNGIILGGGIIGSAVAYELSRRGVKDLHVIDPDMAGTLSSTERNAGGVRHLWQQLINMELARHSISYFNKISEEIGFQHTGYLWLFAKGEERAGLDMLARTRMNQLSYTQLSVEEIKSKHPFIDKTDNLAFAIFGEKDGLINSNALKTHYRNEAKKLGVQFHDRYFASAIRETQSGTEIDVKQITSDVAAHHLLKHPQFKMENPKPETWNSEFVVLACGAWTRELLKDHLADPIIEPIRRQIVLFKAENFDMNQYGMVVDSSRVYFHPEGGNILAGLVLKNEKPGYGFDVDADFFETHIWPALYDRSTHLERLKPITGWGGLYSYTPDTSGILGRLTGKQNIYECHSFTGRGVMQSYGAAIALSELITENRFTTIDASCLSRDRFTAGDNSRLLPEGLHI